MSLLTTNLTTDLLAILLALVCVLISVLKWNQTYWKRRGIPQIEPKFPFGNLSNPLSKNRIAVGTTIENLYNQAKGLKVCGIYFLSTPQLMIRDLNYVKHVVSKDFNYFSERGLYYNEKSDPITGHLVNIGGSKWKNLRRKVTPTFTSGKMKSMFPILVECGVLLEQSLKDIVKKKEPIDIKDILGKFTTDVIGSCAFGLECKSFQDEKSPFREYGKRIFLRTKKGTLKRLMLTSFPDIARHLGFKLVDTEVSDFFFKIVKDSIKYREGNKVERKDFLQLLMDLKSDTDEYTGDGNTLTVKEIVAQCFVFFAAGFETSATTMTFTLFELARNQDIQDRVREEINTVLKKHNNELTYEALNDMTYMSQVVDESLRLYPPVPFVPRVCVEEYKLPDSDIIIEKDTRIVIPIIGIHHDPEYYEKPQTFDPERFSEANKHKIEQYAYIPFGEGNRICIGLRFGLMQAKVGLAVLLKSFKFTLNNRTRVPLRMSPKASILSAEDEVWLNFEEV